MAAALMASLSACSARWGGLLARDIPGQQQPRPRPRGVVRRLLVSIAANLSATPILAIAGLVADASPEPRDLIAGMLDGMDINAPPNILWRRANLLTGNLGINALSYITPCSARPGSSPWASRKRHEPTGS